MRLKGWGHGVQAGMTEVGYAADDVGCGVVDFALEPFPGVTSLAALWRELERRSDCSFFLSWKWIGTWLELTKIQPVVFVGRHAGQVVCLGLLASLSRTRHGVLRSHGLYLNETGDPEQDIIAIEHNGFVVDARFGPTVIGDALEYLLQLDDRHPLLGNWDELRLGGVPAYYEKIADQRGLRRHTINRRGTAVVDLDAIRAGGGDYLASLSANTRYQIRRSMRLYEARAPLNLAWAQSAQEAHTFLDGLKQLHQPYWEARKGKGAFSYPFLVDFHARLVDQCTVNQDYELARVRCGDQDIGYIYNLIRGRWVGFYLGGFRFEEDNKMKPGMVCFAMCLEHHLGRKTSAFDFLAGDQRYKTNLATPQPGLVWFDLQKSRMKLRLEDLARDARSIMRRTASIESGSGKAGK